MKDTFFTPEVVKNIHHALDKMDEKAKEQEFSKTHTADGVELKIGLVVYYADDPTYPAIIKKTSTDFPSSVRIICREPEDRRRKYWLEVPTCRIFAEQCMAFNVKIVTDKASIVEINKEIEKLEERKKNRMELLLQTEDEFAMMVNKRNKSRGRNSFNYTLKSEKYRDKRKKK